MPHEPESMLTDIKNEVMELFFGEEEFDVDLIRVYGALELDVCELRDDDVQFLMDHISRSALDEFYWFCVWLRDETDGTRRGEITGDMVQTLEVNFGFGE
jgi:hypothetical protein